MEVPLPILLSFHAVAVQFCLAQEVDPNDHESVIEVVSHAVLAHCASWQVKKAEELAVFAVQLAR